MRSLGGCDRHLNRSLSRLACSGSMSGRSISSGRGLQVSIIASPFLAMCGTGSRPLDYDTIACYSPPSFVPSRRLFAIMPIHPSISLLLAVWFGLGASLGPRFFCVCSDRTATTQFGERFCCDGPGEDICPVSPDRASGSDLCACLHGGCRAVLMGTESFAVASVDRFENGVGEVWSFDGPDDSLVPWSVFVAERLPHAVSSLRPPALFGSGVSVHHLQSVILLV